MVQFPVDTRSEATSKKLNFAHSFQPIYILSRIFGLMPFTIVFDSNDKIQTARVKVIDLIWFTIAIGIYLCSITHFPLAGQHIFLYILVPDSTLTLAFGTKSIVIFRRLFNCLSIGMEMCNRFKLIEILKNINTFDEKVSYFIFDLRRSFIKTYSLNAVGNRWNTFQLSKRASPIFHSLYYNTDVGVHSDVNVFYQIRR